eukprot:1319564-Amorphochlora_amoeboformis.AAC.1
MLSATADASCTSDQEARIPFCPSQKLKGNKRRENLRILHDPELDLHRSLSEIKLARPRVNTAGTLTISSARLPRLDEYRSASASPKGKQRFRLLSQSTTNLFSESLIADTSRQAALGVTVMGSNMATTSTLGLKI